MQIIRRDGNVKQSGDDYTVAETVEARLLTTDYDTRGESAVALEIATNCAKAISIAIDALAARNMLSKDTIGELLGYDFIVD